MAKSKNGGSRAYIRGRIGSDVYSVGKTGSGAKQQVVRSLAEQVSNPRTESQMFGRMIMSTTMQAVSALKPIIDHSFDGVPAGQPSISSFIRENYALVKADAIAHPASGNKFGLNKYQEKGMKQGQWLIANGSATYPSGVTPALGSQALKIAVGADPTFGTLMEGLGLASDEYLTLISLKESLNFDVTGAIEPIYVRLSIKEGLNTTTALTAENALSAFNLEGNVTPSVSISNGNLTFAIGDDESLFYGMAWSIVSRKVNGSYQHSKTQITINGNAGDWTANEALPTYPTGAQQFLNGGDL